MNIPRYANLWKAAKQLLATAQMSRLLGGAGRIYVEGDNYSAPEGAEDAVWGRLVLVPTQTIWPSTVTPLYMDRVSVLVRAEVNDYPDPAYSAQANLDGIQVEAARVLRGWQPTGLVGIVIMMPFFLARNPQPLPLYDEGRSVLFTSSEYRTWITAPEPGGP